MIRATREAAAACRKPLFWQRACPACLAAGYHSNSKNFINTVTALPTTMDNVEHILDRGYRLKKT